MSIRIGDRPVGMVVSIPEPVPTPEPVIVKVKVPAPPIPPDMPPTAAPPAEGSVSAAGLPTAAVPAVAVVAPVTQPVEADPWSRPLGLFAENRMLRFLHLDTIIGWVFQVRNDWWYAGSLPTANKDPQPSEEYERQRAAAVSRLRKSECAGAPADAADCRAVTEVVDVWKHHDLVHHDDRLRRNRNVL
ncbi:MAG TPA: hypothetical protein VH475_04290 [Tepidisphaeraceae bacterium]|jgi:hypothetical protein